MPYIVVEQWGEREDSVGMGGEVHGCRSAIATVGMILGVGAVGEMRKNIFK